MALISKGSAHATMLRQLMNCLVAHVCCHPCTDLIPPRINHIKLSFPFKLRFTMQTSSLTSDYFPIEFYFEKNKQSTKNCTSSFSDVGNDGITRYSKNIFKL